jgi:hypothetical protein
VSASPTLTSSPLGARSLAKQIGVGATGLVLFAGGLAWFRAASTPGLFVTDVHEPELDAEAEAR